MQTGANIRSARQFDGIVVNLETKVTPVKNLDLVNTGQFFGDYAAEIEEVNLPALTRKSRPHGLSTRLCPLSNKF